jgi:hypothetical protein
MNTTGKHTPYRVPGEVEAGPKKPSFYASIELFDKVLMVIQIAVPFLNVINAIISATRSNWVLFGLYTFTAIVWVWIVRKDFQAIKSRYQIKLSDEGWKETDDN